jgi:predicted secreted protein
MAFYRGEEGAVKFENAGGALVTIASTRNWSMTINKDTMDTTAHGATSRAFIGSLLSGSGSVELMYTATSSDETQDFIKDILQAEDGADALFELYLDTTNSKKISFTGIITSADYSATVGELEVVTCNFITSGAITASI